MTTSPFHCQEAAAWSAMDSVFERRSVQSLLARPNTPTPPELPCVWHFERHIRFGESPTWITHNPYDSIVCRWFRHLCDSLTVCFKHPNGSRRPVVKRRLAILSGGVCSYEAPHWTLRRREVTCIYSQRFGNRSTSQPLNIYSCVFWQCAQTSRKWKKPF